MANVSSPPRTRSAAKKQLLVAHDRAAHHASVAAATASNSRRDALATGSEEDIHEDDVCPVCQLLLYDPVITECKHTLCKSCMATWAEVSISAPMAIVDVNEEPDVFDAATGLEARCPMCRTQTSASLDEARCAVLRERYPKLYAERALEEGQNDEHHENVQSITVYIGNRHQIVAPPEGEDANMHEWTFFVRPSRTDVIEEVQIHLHHTFRPPLIIRSRPPYEIRRLGWGHFTIVAGVVLKAGYSWVSDDAVDSPDGVAKGMLQLEWTLDFDSFQGAGAMRRCKLKVKHDRDWRTASDEQTEEGEREQAFRSYERDETYEPLDGV